LQEVCSALCWTDFDSLRCVEADPLEYFAGGGWLGLDQEQHLLLLDLAQIRRYLL
jgi:hypothetical protein